jgi:hypothetical protein
MPPLTHSSASTSPLVLNSPFCFLCVLSFAFLCALCVEGFDLRLSAQQLQRPRTNSPIRPPPEIPIDPIGVIGDAAHFAIRRHPAIAIAIEQEPDELRARICPRGFNERWAQAALVLGAVTARAVELTDRPPSGERARVHFRRLLHEVRRVLLRGDPNREQQTAAGGGQDSDARAATATSDQLLGAHNSDDARIAEGMPSAREDRVGPAQHRAPARLFQSPAKCLK